MRTIFSLMAPLWGLIGVLVVVSNSLTPDVQAAPSTYLNFQARLLTSSGAVVADGYYHVEFKLYNVVSGGTAQWTETWSSGDNSNRIRVVNGYLTANLGADTAFPGTIAWDEQLWLTMNIGGTGGAASWDGEMNPRILLTALPYAFKSAETLAVKKVSGANTGTLNFNTVANNPAIVLPDASGTVCLQGSSSCNFAASTGGSGYIQNGTTVQTANYNIQSAAAGSIAALISGASGQSVDILQVKADGVANALLSVSNSGSVTLRNSSNSAAAFQVLRQNGNTVLAVDTSTNNVDISNTVTVGTSVTTPTIMSLTNPLVNPDGDLRLQPAAGIVSINKASQNNVLRVYENAASPTNYTYLRHGTLATSNGALAIDTGSAAAINIGTSNANAINLQKNTAITTGNTLSVVGGLTSLTANGASSGDALHVSNSTGGGNIAVFNDDGTAVLRVIDDGGTIISPLSSYTGSALSVAHAGNPSSGNALIKANNTNGTPSGNLLDLQTGGSSRFSVDTGGNLTLGQTGNANSTIRKSMNVSGTIAANDVVVLHSTAGTVTRTTTASNTKVFGVATGSGTPQDIVTSGVYQVNLDSTTANVAIGDFIVTSTEAGMVTKSNNPPTGAMLGRALSATGAAGAGQKIWISVAPGTGGSSDSLQTAYENSTTTEIVLNSTNNGLNIWDNISPVTGNLFSVQSYNASDTYFGVSTTGTTLLGTLSQTAGSLLAGASGYTQTLTNASTTGGTVNGYNQTITVSNTVSASTTNGINISLSDGTALSNINKGLNISLSGANTSQGQYGIDVSVNKGIAVRGITTGVSGTSISCGSGLSGNIGYGVCGAYNSSTGTGTGVIGFNAGGGTSQNSLAGVGVSGYNEANGTAGEYYKGLAGRVLNSNNAAYTSTGVFGEASGGTGSTTYGGYFRIGSGSSGTGAALYASNNTAATNILQLQDNTTDVFTVGDGGGATFQNSSNSSTAFQVQNASGGQLLNIDTNATENIITNGSMEIDTTGWSVRGSSTLSRSTSQKYIGNASLSVATTAAVGDGAKFSLTTATLASNTKYTLTMVARTVPGSSMSTFQMGRQDNGSIDSDCFTTDQSIIGSGWTSLSCTFTTGTTSGTPNIYLEQTDATARTIFIDAVQLTRFSQLNNHSVEQAITASDWQSKGTPTTHARVTTQFIDGAASLQVTTTATADQGTKNNLTLNPSTYYTLSFYAALDTTSAAFSTLEAGYSSDGTTDNTVCTTAQTVRFNWREFRCSFVTPSSNSGTPYFYIKQTDAAIHTFYIDNVRLVKGNALGSYKEGEISLSGIINSPTVFQNQTNSNQAFQIQNATGSSLLSVDTATNVVSLFGSNTGEINSWKTTSSVSEIKARHSSVTWGGYVYTIGDDSGGTTKVEYAKANSDGTLGTWNTTTALPVARERHMSVTWNGYIYAIGGDAANTSYYAKINSDGTIGSWATTTALPINIRHAGTTVANGYVYILGGDTGGTAVYYAKLNADGTLGSWNTTTSIPATRVGPTSQVANGYIYVIGGSLTNTIYYAQLNSNGTVGSWTTDSSLPISLRSHTSVISNGHLYLIGGDTANSGVAASVTYAPINANGSPGTWKTSASQMATPRFAHTSVVVNGYIYAIAGNDGVTRHSSVEYTSTARVRMAGSLDLVGLGGGNLADGSGDIGQGSIGGSLTAGNTKIIGNIEVQGQAAFAQGVAIDKTLRVGGDVLFQNQTNSTTAFQVQNASAATIVNIDTTTNNLITNGSFETDTSGWSAKISLSTGMVRQTTNARNGSASASFTTSATAGSGVRYGSFALSSNTMYNFSAQVRANYGTVAANTIVLGYQNTANQTDTTSDNDCATSPAITTGWTYLSCTFTTGTVTGGGVIYLKQTDATSRALFIDSVQLTLYSSLANPSIEQAISGNWALKNSATVTQDNTQSYIGTNSLKIVTTTAATDGAKQNLTLATSTTYTMSFYAKLDAASAALDTMEAGYSSDGTTDGNVCITGQTVVTTGWTKYTCTLVTPSSTSGTPFIYIKHASATAHTFYVDAFQLIKGQMNDGYQDGRITLNGIISNAITLQNANDSTGAFQVQKADGTSLFAIDTSNNMITLGSASSTPVLLVLGIKNTSGDPTCTSGAIYYNSNTNQFRGCQNSVWKDFVMDTNNTLPWLIDVDVFPTAVSHINWDNIYTGNTSTDSLYQGEKLSSGAQNDEINWNIVLAAGTWDVELIYRTDSDAGIYSVQFDSIEKGTIDSYSASTTNNVRGSVTGITVSTTGKVQLKLKMTSKNASSSNYRGFLKHVQLRRTL